MRARTVPKPKPEWIVIRRLALGGPAAFQDLVEEALVTRKQADSARHALLRAGFIEAVNSEKTGRRGRPRVGYALTDGGSARGE